MTPATRVGATQALCCDCGTLRTMSAKFQGRGHKYGGPEGQSPQRLREAQARGRQTEMQPWWRCMVELTCKTCRKPTAHAYIRADEHRNAGEEIDYRQAAEWAAFEQRLAELDARDDVDVRLEDVLVGSPAKLIQYRDSSRTWFHLGFSRELEAGQLGSTLAAAEALLDNPDRIGEWYEDDESGGCEWRGVRLALAR